MDYKVDSIDGMDGAIAALYSKTDSGYILAVDGLPIVEDPVALKATLTKVRDEKKAEEREKNNLKNQLKEISTKYADIDPSEYMTLKAMQNELLQREDEQKIKDIEAKKDWEALQKRIEGKYQVDIESLKASSKLEIDKREEQLSNMQKSLYEHVAETAIVKELSDAKGKIAILRPHILPSVKIMQEGTVYVPRVIDAQGDIRLNKETGVPMTIKDLVSEFREHPDFQGEGIFEKTKLPGGSNSIGNVTTKQSTDNPWAKDSFNLTKQGEIIKKDPALAAKLKAGS